MKLPAIFHLARSRSRTEDQFGLPSQRRGHGGCIEPMTPERLSHPPSSPYSAVSSPSSTRRSMASRDGSSVRAAARSVACVFVACLTPQKNEVQIRNSWDSYHPKSDPVSRRRRSSGGSTRNGGGSIGGNSRHPAYTSTPRRDLEFTMEQIYKATRNFASFLKIGQGSFGTVYKGILSDGTVVAVKRARKITCDNKQSVNDFQREAQMLAQVKHLNLVRLYGFLEEGDERILVVEYVPNGTLRDHLEGRQGDGLDFAARLDVTIDVAHALTYLHNYADHPIIHRDIKSSNILLTNNLRAKVADFGCARLAADRDSGATHVSTQVKGTLGYLDPEYMKTYRLTEKSDVYSFGVLLVEVFTGRRPIETKRQMKERVTAKWAMRRFMVGDAIMTLDPRVERNPANNWALEKIFQLALECLGSRRDDRPSMKQCSEILWRTRKEYRERAYRPLRSARPLHILNGVAV